MMVAVGAWGGLVRWGGGYSVVSAQQVFYLNKNIQIFKIFKIFKITVYLKQ